MPHADHQWTESSPVSKEDLQRRRHDINRGLRRSHYAVVAASLVIGFFALAAFWLSSEVRHRAQEARQTELRDRILFGEITRTSSKLSQTASRAAHLQREVGSIGQRTKTLEFVREAARLAPSIELREQALSALLLPDVGTNLTWRPQQGFEIASAYDAVFEHFIMNNDRGRAIIQQVADGTMLMDEPGLGRGTPFSQFSPDGRLAVIAFYGGRIGVWDWRQRKLRLQFSTIDARFGEPPFDISPDGKHLWLLATPQKLREYSLETGLPESAIELSHSSRFVRLSPSGQCMAAACGQDLEIWELQSRSRRSTLELTNDIWHVAWQSGEERLAVGCLGGLFLWEVGAPTAAPLRLGGTITTVFFNAEGDLLFAAGWDVVGQVWSVRSRRVVLDLGRALPAELEQPWALSPDQTRLAVVCGRVGYGIQRYLPPVGIREWLAPPSLGEGFRGADLDPEERWVLTGHPHGWLLRDADSGNEIARTRCDLSGAVGFSGDASNVVASTSTGFVHWPLIPRADGTVAIRPMESFGPALPHEWNFCAFSANRRFAAFSYNDQVFVVSTDDPARQTKISLQRPNDNSIYLSRDAHWLVTGRHNQAGLDWYDASTGKFIRRLAEQGLAGPVFDPWTGALFTCTATEHTRWNLETGLREESVPWRVPFASEAFLGFAPDSRTALVKTANDSFQLYDLQEGRGFATLDFRGLPTVYGFRWSRNGGRMFLFGTDGGVAQLNLRVLRRHLEDLGLNWSDDAPSREPPAMDEQAGAAAAEENRGPHLAALTTVRGPVRLEWIFSAGLIATIGIGLYILRYQRRLFAGYLETEALAGRRENELQLTQSALFHSEKMRALGTLSAGVAHDFNNLLSIIRLSNELIEEQVQPQGVTKDNFDAIHNAIQRGRGIVNSMLGYARDDGQPRQFSASELISDAVALLGKSFLGGLVLQVEVAPDTPALFARKGCVEQMLFNLIVNAAEAMHGQGTLTLQACWVLEAGPCLLPPAPASGFVQLGVQDTGPGISPDVLPRMFEPFFTTKTIGSRRGTGLGLSMLYTMAREEGIGVAVSTELGKGTTFRLLLPLENAAPTETADVRAGHHSPIEGAPPTLNPH